MKNYLVTYEKPNRPDTKGKIEATNCNSTREALDIAKAMLADPNGWVFVAKELKDVQ